MPASRSFAVRDAVQGDAARQAQVSRARLLLRVARHLQHDFLGHVLDRAREVHLALRELRLGLARGAAEQALEPTPRHREPGREREVLHVEPDRAVLADVDDLLANQVRVPRLAVRREAHQFVLAAVHLEPAEIGERRVEKTDRVREPQLGQHRELIPAPDPDRGGRPLSHAVHREDRGILVRRRIERRRSVRLVMFAEENPPVPAEVLPDPARSSRVGPRSREASTCGTSAKPRGAYSRYVSKSRSNFRSGLS